MTPIGWQKDWQDICSKVNDRYAEFIKLGCSGVLEYGKLIVQNLMILNGGGIASIPVVLSILKSNNLTIGPYIFMWSAAFYIFGILFAILCALVAYFNFHSMAFFNINLRDEEIQRIYKGLSDDKSAVIEESGDNYTQGMNQYKIAHVFGWMSLMGFLVGCFTLGNGVISATNMK